MAIGLSKDGREMPTDFLKMGYEWVERPDIPDEDIIVSFDRISANRGRYVLQYIDRGREDYSFSFSWEERTMHLSVGKARIVKQPYPFFIDYAHFKSDEDYRFKSEDELKKIFSITAVCLDKYFLSGISIPDKVPRNPIVRISMPQGYHNILSKQLPNKDKFRWKAIL